MIESALFDNHFAQKIIQIGMASSDDINLGRLHQEYAAQTGREMTLAEALIETGVITEVMKARIIKQYFILQEGPKQLGNYRLIEQLGEGGMGAVYLAEDLMLQRQVAIKVLSGRHATDEQFLQRFKREAKAAGNLNHPNICSANVVGEEDGVHYYVMEYCEGETLEAKLNREKTIDLEVAVRFTMEVAEGLGYAHAHGFVHRDIKPDNLFLPWEGTVKILDLGLTKNIEQSKESTLMTQHGIAIGTPHYIAPEQVQCSGQVDGRADIYALGATLYHLLTGQTPYESDNAADILIKHVTGPLPNPQDINHSLPDEIVYILNRMMAINPEERYATCEELKTDLEHLLENKPLHQKTIEYTRQNARTRSPARRSGPAKRSSGAQRAASAPQKRMATTRFPSGSRKSGTRRSSMSAPGAARSSTRTLAIPAPKPYLKVALASIVTAAIAVAVLVFMSGGEPEKRPPTTAKSSSESFADAAQRQQQYASAYDLEVKRSFTIQEGPRIDFMLIPPGSFMRGDPPGEPEGKDRYTTPQKRITIKQPFYLAAFPVTLGMFMKFAEANPGFRTQAEKTGAAIYKDGTLKLDPLGNWKNPGFKQTEIHPVTAIVPEDITAFCQWLSRETRVTMRLPTGHEWEYACRADTASRYNRADDTVAALKKIGWFNLGPDSSRGTSPVAQLAPNAWGLYDMHGDVWERTSEKFIYYADGEETKRSSHNELRGGCWLLPPIQARSANRILGHPSQPDACVGFRVAFSVELKK